MKSHRAFKKIKGGNFWYLRYNQHSVHVVFLLIMEQVDNIPFELLVFYLS